MFSEAIIGQVAPGIVTAMMNYKQKRFERNIIEMLEEFKNRQSNFEHLLANVSERMLFSVRNDSFSILLDYASDEKQVEKIKYIVNGFETILSREITDQDIIISYYETLKSLTLADIKFINKIKWTHVHRGADDLNYNPSKIETENNALDRQILNKLNQLGIVKIFDDVYDYDGKDEMYDLLSIKFTKYGEHFSLFFRME